MQSLEIMLKTFVQLLDRSETAKLLLELPDPASARVEDNQGQTAIVWMIAKMPPVVGVSSRPIKFILKHVPYLKPQLFFIRPRSRWSSFTRQTAQVVCSASIFTVSKRANLASQETRIRKPQCVFIFEFNSFSRTSSTPCMFSVWALF